MTQQLHLPHVRRSVGRGVVAAATIVLSLSAGPWANADDTGPLGDVTDGVGGVTQPVVQPVVGAVQSAVPQPVQEVVAPVVEDVVEPTASHVEQAVMSAPGAGKAAEPVVKVVEAVVCPAGDRAGGADVGAGGRGDEPVEQPAGAPATGTADPVDGPAPDAAAAQASATHGQAASSAAGGSGAGGAAGPATTSPPRDDHQPSRTGGCDDLPPRPTAVPAVSAVSAVGQLPDVREGDRQLWNLTNALMHSWVDGDVPGSVDVGPPSDEGGDAWPLGPLGGADPDLHAPGRWGMVEVLELIGLFGLLGLLAAGLAVVVARQTA